MNELRKISRREFVKRTGQVGGGLVFALSMASACSPAEEAIGPAAQSSVAANVYVNIRNDGRVEIICHRSEMGQGIRTSLLQIVADELEADWDKIDIVQAIGHEKYGDQNTDGSTSIRMHFDLLRNAGATARDMMIAAAARNWGVPAEECVARGHAVHYEDRSAPYGDLVDTAAAMPLIDNATFKSREHYRYIGKPMDTIDGLAFTTGAGNYGIDTVVPNMVHASIERCPAFGGRVVSYDDKAALAVAGTLAVLKLPDPTDPPMFNIQGGVAVVAENTWSATEGRNVLNVAWDRGANGEYDSESYKKTLIASASSAGKAVLTRGNVDIETDTTVDAVYYTPHLSQAPMEPPAAVAAIAEDGSCEVWACTQNPQSTRDTVASTLGIDKEMVTVNVTLLGGGFGRKSKSDFAAEAAWLAREVGRPVKVTWSREDDIRHGYLHAVAAQYFRAGIDSEGKTESWLHRTSFPSITSIFSPGVKGPAGFELGLGALDAPWDVPNMRIETCDAKAHLRIGWLRSVCNVFHAFGACGFVDELAYIKGMDPKEHLLEMIGPSRKIDPADDGAAYANHEQDLAEHPVDTGRLNAVVEKVAEMADWGRVLPDGRGLGIAAHRSFLSYVAVVAEVSVNEQGKLVVHEMWTVIDAGTVINPDRVTAQMEGAGIFGMSIALHGEITAAAGGVVQGNFDTYPMTRMNEAPTEIHCHIVESDAPPGGVGEPGVPPVVPAIVNAYYAATGNRIRELPLRNSGLA